ncbi:glycosyltransferase family 4 protein [Bosea sp. BIWAKO-01]|uniref:glycosyltransferase family 4 protein n=1 Tax=Bosea sp. BIWAKO-01 TaxID=506668 RepID=UPI000A057736|nr:glycosyltransferase family 4 protein [Bosea sp. BIWAKO-01]
MLLSGETKCTAPGAAVDGHANGEAHNDPPISVFAHLAYDKDADGWREAWANGTLVGRNDITPYGYGRAGSMGCRVRFSRSRNEGMLGRLMRLGARVILGFDMAHAVSQRDAIFRSDVVWTHTESQFLAVSALLMVRGSGPKLIGQSVWLFDRWPRFGPIRRALYRFLIRRVDVLTTLSTANAEIARKLFPDKRIEMLHFGIGCEDLGKPAQATESGASVVAVGNDRHRDWKTLIAAVNDLKGVEVDILSHTAGRHRGLARSHVRMGPAKTNDQLRAAYGHASVAVVPLTENAHASGITAILEAVLAGVPVIASDAGGLRSYFTDNEVIFVPVGDAGALSAAIAHVLAQRETSLAMTARAQARVVEGPANLDAYIRRHVEISRELVRAETRQPGAVQER